jgi:hypothetical protein
VALQTAAFENLLNKNKEYESEWKQLPAGVGPPKLGGNPICGGKTFEPIENRDINIQRTITKFQWVQRKIIKFLK